MTKIVKGENVKNSVEENLKENIITLPKEKHYYVTTDDDGNIMGYFPLKEKSLGRDWVALFQNAISKIADEKLTYEEYRVFLKLLSKVDFDNYLRVSQTEIANELGMQRPNVTRAMKGLSERSIIVEGPRAGLNKTYRLNPYIAHKGKNRNNTILDFTDALADNGKNMSENSFD